MNIYSLSVLLFSFGVLLIAILSLVKKKDAVSIRFGAFSANVCGWGFLYSIWTSQNYSPETTLALIRASEVFAVFIPIQWLHFVFEFTGKKEPCKHFYSTNYGIALILAFLCPTPFFFVGVHPFPIFHYYKTAGPGFYVFLMIFITLISYAFHQLFMTYRESKGELKLQLKYLLVGWAISFFCGACTFLPVFNISVFLPGFLLMPLYPIFVGISLIRYGMFENEKILDAFQREKLAAIGTMAASLNRELRNPLYIAKGKIETQIDAINQGIATCDSKNYAVLSTALHQLTRAMDIMQRFSDFAKPKSVNLFRLKRFLTMSFTWFQMNSR
jgi:hypothetical protein